jgi:hypothetical protein
MVYLMIDRLLSDEYKLGEPWKLPRAAGFLVPLLRDAPYDERGYVLLQEVEGKVEFRDTGSISAVEVKNKSGFNVFIRKGTMLKGQGTQSRSPVNGIIVEPFKKYVPIPVNCIHASHGISTGAGFEAEGVAPQSIYQSLGHQSSTWASINRYTSKLKSSMRERAPIPEARLMDVAEDNLVETEVAAKEVTDVVEDALSKIPGDLVNQIGVVVFDLQGIVAVELFDHPDSWHAFSKSIVRSYGEILTEEVSELIEVRTDKAVEFLKTFLQKAKNAKSNLITENNVSKIWRLIQEEVEGEVAELEGKEIHVILSRPRGDEMMGEGVDMQLQELISPSPYAEAEEAEDLLEIEGPDMQEFIQKKGSFNLLEQLARTPQRFSELVQERFVSRRTLSTRIKEAEELGLVQKGIRKTNGSPAYTLTDTGEEVKKKSEEKVK